VTPQPGELFDSATAEGRLTRFYGVGRWTDSAVFARRDGGSGGVIAYVERRRFPSGRCCSGRSARMPASTAVHRSGDAGQPGIERTLSGARQGSLLKAIDRTVTGGGGRLLAEGCARR
jgi:DNA mismatch repair protein MutS